MAKSAAGRHPAALPRRGRGRRRARSRDSPCTPCRPSTETPVEVSTRSPVDRASEAAAHSRCRALPPARRCRASRRTESPVETRRPFPPHPPESPNTHAAHRTSRFETSPRRAVAPVASALSLECHRSDRDRARSLQPARSCTAPDSAAGRTHALHADGRSPQRTPAAPVSRAAARCGRDHPSQSTPRASINRDYPVGPGSAT